MAQVKWDDSLEIGIDLIDEQHKMLIEKLNDLSKAIEMLQGDNKVMKTLEFMIDYTNFHFTSEEKQMAENQYPGLPKQQEQHEKFKSTLNGILEDFEEEGLTPGLTTSVNTFLVNWLISHIKGMDMEFGEYLRNKDSAS